MTKYLLPQAIALLKQALREDLEIKTCEKIESFLNLYEHMEKQEAERDEAKNRWLNSISDYEDSMRGDYED